MAEDKSSSVGATLQPAPAQDHASTQSSLNPSLSPSPEPTPAPRLPSDSLRAGPIRSNSGTIPRNLSHSQLMNPQPVMKVSNAGLSGSFQNTTVPASTISSSTSPYPVKASTLPADSFAAAPAPYPPPPASASPMPLAYTQAQPTAQVLTNTQPQYQSHQLPPHQQYYQGQAPTPGVQPHPNVMQNNTPNAGQYVYSQPGPSQPINATTQPGYGAVSQPPAPQPQAQPQQEQPGSMFLCGLCSGWCAGDNIKETAESAQHKLEEAKGLYEQWRGKSGDDQAHAVAGDSGSNNTTGGVAASSQPGKRDTTFSLGADDDISDDDAGDNDENDY